MDRRVRNFKYKGRTRIVVPFSEAIPHPQQIQLVNELFMSHSNPPTLHQTVLTELKRKRNGYKAQDVRRDLYREEEFISIDSILEHLVVSRLRCAYCHENVEVAYTQVRSPTQWTLDRIDNHAGHSKTNTVVSCLQCNLRRGTLDYEKFKFTKDLQIVKVI